MTVSLSKEVVNDLAKLRITNVLVLGKKDKKSPEDLAGEILNVLEKECHFDVVEEK